MLAERRDAVNGKEILELCPPAHTILTQLFRDMLLKLLISDNYLFVVGKAAYHRKEARGVYQIDRENSVKYPDKEGKSQILRQPFQCAEDMRMYKKIICRAEQRPEKCK